MREKRKPVRKAAVKPAKRRKVTRLPPSRPRKIARRDVAARRAGPELLRAAPPPVTQKPASHALHNRLVLVLGTAALTALSGSAAWFGVFDRAGAVPSRHQQEITIESKIDTQATSRIETVIDAQVVARREIDDNLPLIANLTPPQITAPVAKPMPPVVAPARGPEVKRPVASSRPQTPKVTARTRGKARRLLERQTSLGDDSARTSLASAGSSALIEEARRYLGTNPTGRAHDWCGAFLDMVLKQTGRRGGGNLARGYVNYGPRLAGPEVGAIVIFARAGGGHVGIVTGIDANGNPIVISGNHNHRVAEATYPARRAIAYVQPGG